MAGELTAPELIEALRRAYGPPPPYKSDAGIVHFGCISISDEQRREIERRKKEFADEMRAAIEQWEDRCLI